jgi:hypothetical protein
MPSASQRATRRQTRATVTLMARVPQDLATQVQTYATTHGLAISTLVRAGLLWALTQPPATVVPPPPPAKLRPRQRKPPRLQDKIMQVLAEHPEGLEVWEVWGRLSRHARIHPTRYGLRHPLTRAEVGMVLRHLYRTGRVVRQTRGVYALPSAGGGAGCSRS